MNLIDRLRHPTGRRRVRLSITIPDDLASRVVDLGLPVSAICQTALRTAADTAAGTAPTATADPCCEDVRQQLALIQAEIVELLARVPVPPALIPAHVTLTAS